ncbi:MAG: STAS domain-containing protein [Bacteroidia bacterium]
METEINKEASGFENTIVETNTIAGKQAKINSPSIKSINLSGDKFIITDELSGVFCGGVQYYDLKNILFINNNGIANLIDLLKSLLKEGVEVQFVNVSEKIKEKIKTLGLENVITCR